MVKTVSATEARIHFGELMDDVETKGHRIIVERGGKRAIALVPILDLERLIEAEPEPEDWFAKVMALRAEMAAKYGDKPLSISPEEIIRRMRDEE